VVKVSGMKRANGYVTFPFFLIFLLFMHGPVLAENEPMSVLEESEGLKSAEIGGPDCPIIK